MNKDKVKLELDNDGDSMWRIPVKELKRGEFLKLSLNANEVWYREEYDREYKEYWISSMDDISKGKLIKGSRKVYVGFTY